MVRGVCLSLGAHQCVPLMCVNKEIQKVVDEILRGRRMTGRNALNFDHL